MDKGLEARCASLSSVAGLRITRNCIFACTSNAKDEAVLIVSLGCILSEPYDQRYAQYSRGRVGIKVVARQCGR
jgi:hypothetical protein